MIHIYFIKGDGSILKEKVRFLLLLEKAEQTDQMRFCIGMGRSYGINLF